MVDCEPLESMMPVRMIVGANWGDEGKGRMVDYFADSADVVVRYQGGHNAGHTIVNQFGKFILRLIPSGIFSPDTVNVIGPGCVVNLEALWAEIESLTQRGIAVKPANLRVSDRATICLPFHVDQDRLEEARLGKNKVGSTLQGVGPAYGDKYMRLGIQLGWLSDADFLKAHTMRVVEAKNASLGGTYNAPPLDEAKVLAWLTYYGAKLQPFIQDTTIFLDQTFDSGKHILMEAQLGSLRDLSYGIYPFTTSSHPIASFAPVGSGLFKPHWPTVTAVVKAFSTCVGEGPFVTEIHGPEADAFRQRTGEFGAATGRPRRIGHFDAVATRYGVKVQTASEVALTKLDNLSEVGKLQICTAYETRNGPTSDFPLLPQLVTARPVYEEMEGWHEDISGIRTFDALPVQAQAYVRRIEELIDVPVKYVSVGPERDSLIVL